MAYAPKYSINFLGISQSAIQSKLILPEWSCPNQHSAVYVVASFVLGCALLGNCFFLNFFHTLSSFRAFITFSILYLICNDKAICRARVWDPVYFWNQCSFLKIPIGIHAFWKVLIDRVSAEWVALAEINLKLAMITLKRCPSIQFLSYQEMPIFWSWQVNINWDPFQNYDEVFGNKVFIWQNLFCGKQFWLKSSFSKSPFAVLLVL